MTDGDLIIRHVRFCDCGKPAGHDSICKPGSLAAAQRIDRAWEEQNAERRGERFAKRKLAFDAERRAARAKRREETDEAHAFRLHREAHERAAKISTVAAAQVGRSSPNSETQRVGPTRQQTLDDDPRWRESWAVIRSRLERVHELLDEAEGLSTVAATTNMLGIDKDRRVIAEGEGLSPVAVVEKLGRDIAGSPETVRRIRKKYERSTIDGRVRLP